MNSKKHIHRICSSVPGVSFVVRYWDGESVHYGDAPPQFIVTLKSKAVVDRLFGNVVVRLPEAYTDGDIEIEGDLQQFCRMGFLAEASLPKLSLGEKASLLAAALWRRNDLARSRSNVAHHYDLGNDFFRLWLDRQMVYSCAHFRGADDDIDTAQKQKLEYLCAKLRLKPGQHLLEIGCGWGALAIHAARTRGVQVVGLTLSEEQRKEAQMRIVELGLGDRITIRLQDYRELAANETFDRIVSVGMLEHVGQKNIRDYLALTARHLAPGGAGVLHTIGRMLEAPVNPWIKKHIFPGSYLPCLAELVDGMAHNALNVIDVENLRLHYARTLERWTEKFERHADEVRKSFDDRFVRMWRMYLLSSAAGFRYGGLNLWQIVFTKGLADDLPLTRDYMYSPTESV